MISIVRIMCHYSLKNRAVVEYVTDKLSKLLYLLIPVVHACACKEYSSCVEAFSVYMHKPASSNLCSNSCSKSFHPMNHLVAI